MSYVPTTFNNLVPPPLNAQHFNDSELGIAQAHVLAEAAQARADSAYALASTASGATQSALLAWAAPLDSFVNVGETAGVNVADDTLLTRALTYAGAQTRCPVITVPLTRKPTFTQGGRTPFTGMRISNPGFFAGQYWVNVEQSAGKNAAGGVIRLNVGTGASSWFVNSAETFGGSIGPLAIESTNGSSQMWHSSSLSGNAYCWTFHNLATSGLKHVIGMPGSPAYLTACSFTGEWNNVNARGRQFDLGGSDSKLWMDSRANVGPSGSGTVDFNGEYLAHISMNKTRIGPFYATCDDNSRGMLIDGNNTYQYGMCFYGLTLEGRNKDKPCNGTLLRINGGGVDFFGIDLNFAMANPTGVFASDKGLAFVTGGQVTFHSPSTDYATGVSKSTVPLIYASGGEVGVRGVKRGEKSGVWGATRPRAQQASAGFIVDSDYSVNLVTAA